MTSEYKIESNIQIPVGYKGCGRKYPFDKLEIGQSIYFEGERASVQNAAFAYGKFNNKKFCTRKEGNGFRVWRTA